MFNNPSLITRVGVGKLVGMIIGLVGFFMIPIYFPETPLVMRWGLLFWYITLGAIVGLMGVMNYHPMLNISLPWWFRGAIMGGWMNFVLTLLIFDWLTGIMAQAPGLMAYFTSPWWFVLEGVVLGMIIDFLCTRFGGEGPESAQLPNS